MTMTTSMFEALRLKYNAQIAQASANINVYMINPAGIGEHPDLVEAVDSQIKLIAEAQDNIDVLHKYYGSELDVSV